MIKVTEYGEGGFDETKPNNNIVNQYEIEESPTQELKQIPTSALDELSTKLSDPSVNSIAEVKSALSDFVAQIR